MTKRTTSRRTATGWTLGAMIAGLSIPAAVGAFPALQAAQPPKKSAAQTPARKPAVNPNAVPIDKNAFFESKIRPILAAKCQVCHEGAEASGKFDMSSRAGLLKGGHSGSALNLSKPAESLLLTVVHYKGAVKMPPQGKLPQAEINLLTQWVAMGAPWPETKTAHGEKPAKTGTKHWAFVPVTRPAVPKPKNAKWVRNPIDAFVLAKLEENGMMPAPPASKTALLRRLHYDLIGLPPTPDEVRAFVADTSPNAYEKVVEKLLASPQYGERWGRHWLDLVRYAETNSFERDGDKPFIWRYRDYVINAFNSDKPYDRFLIEQLAGDELDTVTPETLIATGYYRLGQWDDEPADPLLARYDELDDIVATTSQTMLGLTANCARCHDHKIDPFPQKDYYKMVAFFQGTTRYGIRSNESVAKWSLRPISSPEEQKRHADEMAIYRGKLDALTAKMAALEEIAKKDFVPVEHEEFRDEMKRPMLLKRRVPKLFSEAQFAEYEAWTKERRELRARPPKGLEMALCITEDGPKPVPTPVLMRGNPHAPGDEVQPGFPEILGGADAKMRTPKPDGTSMRRRAFAEWVASPQNTMTARVMVNRIWQYHFGRGLVRTTSNFGLLGTPPSHPELLDWLAAEFATPTTDKAQAWRMKRMHRLMVLSNTYRMSSQGNPKYLAKDPENEMYWRFDMRRLEAEEVRDSILAASGNLNLKMFGPSIKPPLPKEVLAGQSVPGAGWDFSSTEESARRSVYVKIKRSLAVPLIAAYDGADTDFTCPVRFATTQPTQALTMMNSAFTQEQAKIFADSLTKSVGTDPAAQVKLGLWRTLQRSPTEKEITRGVTLIGKLQKEQGLSKEDALKYFCVVLLNLNEFIYLD